MKQLLKLLCIAFLLCSCSALKKSTNNTESNTDSTGTKSSSIIDVKKKDSATNTTTQATEKTQTEGSYKKTTVNVKEYFGDEFGFSESEKTPDKAGSVAAAKDTSKQTAKAPAKKPYYRETTTTIEEGLQKQTKEANMVEEKSGKVAGVDSSANNQNQGSTVSSSQEGSEKNTSRFTLLPWWAIIILIIAGVVFIIYKVVN